MFEARLLDGAIFKNIIEAIKDLVTEANMDVSEEGLTIQYLYSERGSLVDVSLPQEAFDQFHCDEPLRLGFSPPTFSKIFKMMKKDDILILKAEDNGKTLKLIFETRKAKRTTAFFDLNLLYVEDEKLALPNTPYKCSVRMSSSEFQKIIRDLLGESDTCTISFTKEGVLFSAAPDIGSTYRQFLIRPDSAPDKQDEQVVIDVEAPVEAKFALRFLNFFTKATALSRFVIISLSPDVPVVIEYPIGQVGHVKYFLSPNAETERGR